MDKVKVPQSDGQITIRQDGGEPRTWNVREGLVTPATLAEQALLVATIDGATVVTEQPASHKAGGDTKEAPKNGADDK